MGRKINCVVSYAAAVLKIMCIVIIALGVPWLFKDKRSQGARPHLGIEEFTDTMLTSIVADHEVYTRRAALVVDAHTFNTVINQHIELLHKKDVCIATVFVMDDGSINMARTVLPGITVMPIKKDEYDLLAQYDGSALDCIMIDMQETGFVRYDGEPLLASLKMASAAKKPVIVFDRPNLLGPSIEGFSVWLGGRALIPSRHGMTIGELAQFCNRHVVDKPVALHVVHMKHYQRLAQDPDRLHLSSHFCMRGLIDIMQEIQPFEVRISPDNKYHCIMLPVSMNHSKRMWRELSLQLKRVGIEGNMFTYCNDETGESYAGLNLSIMNMNKFSFNSAVLTVLRFFNDNGLKFTYSERLRDMIGMHAVQSYLAGHVSEKEAHHALEHEAQLFFSKACGSFLYQPLPRVMAI
jgi:hypothetical protein